MKLPIDWLKEFVEVKESTRELAEIFTLLGAEVESTKNDVLDLEITPNRSDWLSVYGLAREFAVYTDRPLKKIPPDDLVYKPQSKILDLTFEDKKLFPRYSAIVFDKISVKPASKKIQNRLKQLNINVHNNIIDITNYVMMEFGLPLHAFDLDEITDHKMLLRQSKMGEKLETLDEKLYSLPKGSLVIEDGKRLIDLMGIKGGANSGIKNSTKKILLQAMVDDPKRIRSISKKIGLATESSYRFERGVDQQSTLASLQRAKQLILESCEATILESIDIINEPTAHRTISLDTKRMRSLLGTNIGDDFAKQSLTRLGFGIKDWQVAVPSWRLRDVFFEEDLIEEVARIYGYEKLEKRVLKSEIRNKKFETKYQQIQNIKKFLTNNGFTEIYNYTLVSKNEANDKAIEIEKPLSPETAYLRTSLLPGIIKTVARNAWYDDIRIFEIGSVFTANREETHLAIASASPDQADGKMPSDMNLETITPTHPLGKLNKLRRTIYVYETDYSRFFENSKIEKTNQPTKLPDHVIKYRAISNFPPAVRDIAIIVKSDTKSDDIAESIKSADDRILIVELFDEFKSEKFGPNKKSLAFHIIFDDPKKTMNDKEISNLTGKISQLIQKGFQAVVR